jgi:hypothetical protein
MFLKKAVNKSRLLDTLDLSFSSAGSGTSWQLFSSPPKNRNTHTFLSVTTGPTVRVGG